VPRPAARLLAVSALALAALACAVALLGCGANGARTVSHSEVPGLELVRSPGRTAAWSPDSREIASTGDDGSVQVGPPAARKPAPVKAPRLVVDLGEAAPIRFSADGRRLLYVTAKGTDKGRGAWAVEVARDGGRLTRTPLGTADDHAAFAPGGWPLVFGVGPYVLGTKDGSEQPTELRILARPGARPRRLLRTVGMPQDPVIDGDHVLFKQWVRKPGAARWRGHTELWTVGLDGSHPHRLAASTFIRSYAYSPRGGAVAFAATSHSGSHLYLATGDGRSERLGSEEVTEGPVWSPDGRWLIFGTPEGDLRRIHPDGRGAQTIAEFPGDQLHDLAISPDGKRLLYAAWPPPEPEYGD
jgi:hypothetical protein